MNYTVSFISCIVTGLTIKTGKVKVMSGVAVEVMVEEGDMKKEVGV